MIYPLDKTLDTAPDSDRSDHSGWLESGIFFLLVAILLWAPLIKGGNRPLPLLALELMALPLAAWLVWQAGELGKLPRLIRAALLLLLLYPLLQLVPLPPFLWQWLPGFAIYAEAINVAGLAAQDWRSASVMPQATWSSWLALLVPLTVMLITLTLKEQRLRQAVYVFLAMATLQAILALTQYGGGSQTDFRLSPTDFGQGVGTYANRNHLAGLLEMALPIGLGLLAASIGRKREAGRYVRSGLLARLQYALSHPPRVNAAMVFSAISIAILLGVIFSRSRTGISLAMLGIFLAALLYGRHIGGRRSKSLTGLFSVLGLALAIEIGLAPVLDRFSVGSTLEDARWTIFSTSFQGAMTFFPFGSGLGTFPDVYWRFQPDSIGLFVNHAHNDYLEFLFEAGVVAVVVMALLLVVYVLRWPVLLRHAHWSRLNFMQVGAGIGLFVMVLHGLTDYNLHIPANAIYFAFLAGVFFHRSGHRRQQHAAGSSADTPTSEGRALEDYSASRLDPPAPALPGDVVPSSGLAGVADAGKTPASRLGGQNPFAD